MSLKVIFWGTFILLGIVMCTNWSKILFCRRTSRISEWQNVKDELPHLDELLDLLADTFSIRRKMKYKMGPMIDQNRNGSSWCGNTMLAGPAGHARPHDGPSTSCVGGPTPGSIKSVDINQLINRKIKLAATSRWVLDALSR